MELEDFKQKVLDGFYTKHPYGKELLDIDIRAVTAKHLEWIVTLEEQLTKLEQELENED